MTQTITPSTASLALDQPIEQLAINTIRTLSMDAVQAANSGHPGTPMALAPVAYTLWQQFLRFDPERPIWANRDRFVLSVGHASALLYSLLHLTGVKSVNPQYETLGEPAVPLDDLKRFRQLDSKCPGHPEYRWTAGRGVHHRPAGHRHRHQRRHGHRRAVAGGDVQPARVSPCSTTTCTPSRGDGCLMEGIGAEAASLAGHQRLANLCWIYDNNKITIEGGTAWRSPRTSPPGSPATAGRCTTSRRQRPRALAARVRRFKAETGPPDPDHRGQRHRLRRAHQAGTHAAHGEPLGAEEVRGGQAVLRLARGRARSSSRDGVREHFADGMRRARRASCGDEWEELFAALRDQYPDLADQLDRMQRRQLPDGWDADLPDFPADAEGRRRPRRQRQGAQRRRAARAVADRRLRRPGPVEQDAG